MTDLFCEALRARSAEDLHAASVEDILRAQAKVDIEVGQGVGLINRLAVSVGPFYPVVEGSVLPVTPLEAIQRGASADVAVLTGTNQDEMTLWGYDEVDEERLAKLAIGLGADEGIAAAYRARGPTRLRTMSS